MAMYTQRSTLTQIVLGYGGLAVVLLIVLIPYSYIALTAFKPAEEIFDVRWLPRVWSLDAWRYAIEFEQFHVYIYNSMIAGLGAAVLALCVAVPGAYVFGRKQFRGKDVMFYIIVMALLFPFVLLVVPFTILWVESATGAVTVGGWG